MPHQHKRGKHKCGIRSPHITDHLDDLQLSHLTCPLQKPDGESDDNSLPPPLDTSFSNSNQSTPKHQLALAPPEHFADSSGSMKNSIQRPREGSRLVAVKKGNEVALSTSNTTSDSYDYDDYLPPPTITAQGQGQDSMHSDASWPQPPIVEETFAL